jgi:outer membrane protein assembly factor BamB
MLKWRSAHQLAHGVVGLLLICLLFPTSSWGAQRGNVKWTFTAARNETSPAIASDGTIYLGSGGKVYAINSDGSPKWTFDAGGEVQSSPAIGSDGTIYVGATILAASGYTGKLYAINPDGTQKATFITGGALVSSPAVGVDGIIYVGSYDRNLYAIFPHGAKKWEFSTGDFISSSPAIDTDGTVYVGSADHKLYAVSQDGLERWSFQAQDRIESSPAIGADGTIYVGSYDGNLYAINPNGTTKWSFATGGAVASSPAIGTDGTIYVGSHDGSLYAVNNDGTQKWSFDTGGAVRSSPAIAFDGTICVGSDGTNLHAIKSNGKERWIIDTAGSVRSSPAIGPDGTIYVGSGGYLYAIEGGFGELASSPWPMFHGDLRHTGRASDHDTLNITGGMLNEHTLNPNAPLVRVSPGEIITGTVDIRVLNLHEANVTFPVGWAWSWATYNADGHSEIVNSAAPGQTDYTLSVYRIAPSDAGTYYITFAAGAFAQTANLFANKCGTDYPSADEWNNGNDIGDLGNSEYYLASTQHWIRLTGDGGCTNEIAIAMLKVMVCDGPCSDCVVDITGASISGTLQPQSQVSFSIEATNRCEGDIYYSFLYHPDYGTDEYDGTQWELMTTEQYVTSSQITYAFPGTGKYIVVVWAVVDTDNSEVSGVSTIGFSVDIIDDGPTYY